MAMIVLTPVEVEAEVGNAAEILTLGQSGPQVLIVIRRTVQRKSRISHVIQSSISYMVVMRKTLEIL